MAFVIAKTGATLIAALASASAGVQPVARSHPNSR